MRTCLRAIGLSLVLAGLAAPRLLAAPTGFAFLEIPSGARASALAGAYASLAEGAEASFWNPAGLGAAQKLEIVGGHSELFEKLRHDYFAVSGRRWGGGLGASIRALYSEPIEERDELGNLIGTFGSHDLELGMGYGRPMGGGLALGASAQLFRERISNSSVMTYGFGVGATWEPAHWTGLRLGVSGQNLGPGASYTIDGTPGLTVTLPAAVQAGVSYRHPMGQSLSLRGALEGRLTRGRNGVGMVGAEITSPVGASLRAGIRANDDASSLSFGAGYSVRSLRLDYAYVPLRLDLGDTHRFAFATQF